jgi:hypothetical protein
MLMLAGAVVSVTLAEGESNRDHSSYCGREGALRMQFALKDALAL